MEKKEKIVFFDIDGTLLDENKQLVPSARDAIFRLRQKGVRVALATGRAPFMFENLLRDLEINTYISFNGQYVVSMGRPIFKNPLDHHKLQILEKSAQRNAHPLVYLDEKEMRASEAGHPFVQKSLNDLRLDYPDIDPAFYRRRHIYQALVFCEEKDHHLYEGQYEAFRFIRWHDYSVDIVPAGGSKAEGIARLLNVLGLSRENVYAFGDGRNDLEMLRFAGVGVAMGNAHEETKEAADYVTKAVDEDGILYGLLETGLLSS